MGSKHSASPTLYLEKGAAPPDAIFELKIHKNAFSMATGGAYMSQMVKGKEGEEMEKEGWERQGREGRHQTSLQKILLVGC